MNCYYHSDRDVERECRICHELVCSECVVPVGDHAVCKSCISQTVTLEDAGLLSDGSKPLTKADKKKQRAIRTVQRKQEALHTGHKSFWLTTLFSCLPGLGHYYLGLQVRGVQLMILFFGLIVLNTIMPSNSLQFITGISLPIMWFYVQMDAHKYRDAINRGETVEDRPIYPRWKELLNIAMLGWLFAIFGVIALAYGVIDLAGVGNWELREALKQLVSAALFLGAGFWIVKGKPLPFPSQTRVEESDNSGEHA
ncbi:hypothetical protein EV586_105241 [Tumebacillus sp. BK434]|uniref:hypothetical protein n=1 Tax=Tumebacillus sp. BK434 TaxID=2512169 RepID=UPI0010472DA0|nr:hypothetical protein [Tumebacillus sp. BK434]TCP53895.1 hypothetical protein EV586_105241 [Tumebacillus sp. BK434]